MLSYKHVLLATGLAENAQKVAQQAKRIAEESGAKLSLVHVIEHSPLIFGSGEYSIPLDVNIEEKLTDSARDALTSLATELNITEDDQYILHGSPKNEICELAEKINADLIVVGTHARFGTELLLGSTANAILHAAKCDVYAVNNRK